MARPHVHALKAAYPDRVLLGCSFQPNNTDPPTLVQGDGITSVARTGVGIHVITLEDDYAGMFAFGGLNKAAGAAGYLVGCVCDHAAKTVTVTFTTEAGVATDVTGVAGDTCVVVIYAAQNPLGGVS